MYPQYKDYNKVIVEIRGKGNEVYKLSNINKSGLPGEFCGCHLESLTIESPAVSNNNPADIGTTGEVTIIDYKDSVFKYLSTHLSQFMDGDKPKSGIQNKELLPKIHIEIWCYTNHYSIDGHILLWSMQFSGTTPSINLTWSTVCPGNMPKNGYISPSSRWTHPGNLIDELQKKYSEECGDTPFILKLNGHQPLKNQECYQYLRFKEPDGVCCDLSKCNSTGNVLIDGYDFICKTCEAGMGSNYEPIHCAESSSSSGFVAQTQKFSSNNDTDVSAGEGASAADIIFINNGKYPAYSKYTFDNKDRTVIPITSFNFDTDFNKLTLQSGIRQNPNGTVVSGNSRENSSASSAEHNEKLNSDQQTSDAITVKFECYNTMVFKRNNLNSPVQIKVFNEFGQEHVASGMATVRACTYSLQGAVIKASVECTQVFNTLITSISKPSGVGGSTDVSYSSESGSYNTKSESSFNYFKTEDSIPVPLELDKTSECINSGKLNQHVDEFLENYGGLTNLDRVLDYKYVSNLVEDGNFGLLCLLIAVANWGVSKDYPSNWKQDAYTLLPEYKDKRPFCASDQGKTPYDYKSGGLGIPHFDSDNFLKFYTTFGFDNNISDSTKKHFESLLLSEGNVTGWSSIKFNSEARLIPTFASGSKPRNFDNGLKQDSEWLNWANNIVYFKNKDDQAIYQQYLTKYWIENYWLSTMQELKKYHSTSNHVICVQDAIRIARMKNSGTNQSQWGSDVYRHMYGCTVAEQSDAYGFNLQNASEDRYNRQKAFCRRCGDILGWELSRNNKINCDRCGKVIKYN